MEILVCVKRVPQVGGKIVVTADGQEVDTRMAGFAMSPHEECAVEEAVRLTEADGGTSTVLTLGPDAAVEQLQDALALGIGRAVLLETDGREWDPAATAGAIVEAVRADAAAGPEYDLLLFGNEAADTGDYQVGIRVARRWACRASPESRLSRSKTEPRSPGGSCTEAGRSSRSRCRQS